MTRGKYIVIEGHDGTGKSTQVELLRAYLTKKGIKSIEFHEPEDETLPITSALRSLIKDGNIKRRAETNVLLFTAARHEIWHKRAVPALSQGTWVVASRNYLSTLAYQGSAEGVSHEMILSLTRTFTDETYLHPDGCLVLTVKDEATRLSRVKTRKSSVLADTFEQRDASFQKRIAKGYDDISRSLQIPVLDADTEKEEVHVKILAELRRQLDVVA